MDLEDGERQRKNHRTWIMASCALRLQELWQNLWKIQQTKRRDACLFQMFYVQFVHRRGVCVRDVLHMYHKFDSIFCILCSAKNIELEYFLPVCHWICVSGFFDEKKIKNFLRRPVKFLFCHLRGWRYGQNISRIM